MSQKIKIKFIEDCPEVELTLWTLKEAITKDNSFIFVNTIEEADLIVASRHYWIHSELDKIKGRKLIWVNYGTILKSITAIPLIKTEDEISYDASDKMWAFFAPSPIYKKALENYNLDTSHVKFLGWPKMDLNNYNYNTSLESLNLKPKWRTVLYTPTIGWKTCTCESSFFDYVNKMVFWSLEYKFNLIIRPHPYLLKQFPEIKIDLDNINKLNNVHVDYSYNYYAIFHLVDFIVSDISSMAYEFLVTTKPVVLTKTCLKDYKLIKEYIDNNIMYEVRNSRELENRIRLLLANYDEFRNRREAFVNILPKTPSILVKNYIKEKFLSEK